MYQRIPQSFAVGLALAIAVAAVAPPNYADEVAKVGEVSEFRAKMSKWVEARELVSREKSDWLIDREYLIATRDLLRTERDALRQEVAELEAGHVGSDEERRSLVLERGEYQRSARQLAAELAELEHQVLKVIPQLPPPLTKRLEPLLVQIPEEPAVSSTPLGQRLMNVLGILLQSEKFNSTATLVGETKAVEGDQKVQVRTLYWGLGEAISVDASGRMAGISRPTADGWQFTSTPELADEASLLLDIYEGNVDEIAFIPVPVEIPR